MNPNSPGALESSPLIWARASRRLTTYARGWNLHHVPLLTTPLQGVAPEPSAGLHSGQGSTRPTNTSLRGLSCQVIYPQNKPLCALFVQGKLPNHQSPTQTHAHLRLSYGAPVCRIKADSCGPFVRAVGVAPKCRHKTCELHGRGSKDFVNQLWPNRYIHT